MKSNETLLIIRQNLVSYFKRYEYLIIPVCRFILSFSILNMLKIVTEYEGLLNSNIILAGIALIGTFASAQTIIVCMILLTSIFVLSSNVILGSIVFVVLCLIYILYGHLFPKESIIIIFMLVAFKLKAELLVVFAAALFGSYACVVAIGIGTMIWYTMPVLMHTLPSITLDKAEVLETINKLLIIDYKSMLINKEMLIMLIIFFITFTGIYIIKNIGIDYGPYIGIAVGASMNILGIGLAQVFFDDIDFRLLLVVGTTLLFSFIASCIQFLSVALDYQRAEFVHFEDDDNLYYVKIIPKIQIRAKKKNIKHVYTENPTDRLHATNVMESQAQMSQQRASEESHFQTPQQKARQAELEKERIRRIIMEDDDFKF